MSDPVRPGFWHTMPGILTAVAAVITALTGLLVGLAQIGYLGGGSGAGGSGVEARAPAEPSIAVQPSIPVQPSIAPAQRPNAVTADAVAGRWAGQAKDGTGTTFQVTMDISLACTINQSCGSIRVSHVPCSGELFLYAVSEGTYEFSVKNFSADSGKACTPGAGEYLSPQPDGTLRYTTGYDTAIDTTLRKTGA